MNALQRRTALREAIRGNEVQLGRTLTGQELTLTEMNWWALRPRQPGVCLVGRKRHALRKSR